MPKTGMRLQRPSSGQAHPGQNPLLKEDEQCGQEGVESIVQTKDWTPYANY